MKNHSLNDANPGEKITFRQGFLMTIQSICISLGLSLFCGLVWAIICFYLLALDFWWLIALFASVAAFLAISVCQINDIDDKTKNL